MEKENKWMKWNGSKRKYLKLCWKERKKRKWMKYRTVIKEERKKERKKDLDRYTKKKRRI